jgi:hypothetical protein
VVEVAELESLGADGLEVEAAVRQFPDLGDRGGRADVMQCLG